jgi:hypothetical protein
MQMTISTVTFLVGLALIVLGVFGGGIEVKEIKIPTLATVSRCLSVGVGFALIILCLWFPELFTQNQGVVAKPADNTPATTATVRSSPVGPAEVAKPSLGSAIRNGLTTVREVKLALRNLGKYAGPIDDEPTTAYFQAVADFQVSQNIEIDGLVGAATYGKLREAVPQFFSPTPKTAVNAPALKD